jgi:hypothetical protein
MPVTKLPAEYEMNASGRKKVLRRFDGAPGPKLTLRSRWRGIRDHDQGNNQGFN